MKKIRIKDIIEFRSKSEKGKKNFATSLLLDKEKAKAAGGGDYWISCVSAISSSYKSNDSQIIVKRRDDLKERYKETENFKIKTMYKRNIDILDNFSDFDFKKWRGTNKLKFLRKPKDSSIIIIKGLQVEVIPHHVFSFQTGKTEEVGAIWFIAKLNGFKKDELGMFVEAQYKHLKAHFSKDYTLNSKYCIAVDVFKNTYVNYSQLEKNEVSNILNSTLDEIKKHM